MSRENVRRALRGVITGSLLIVASQAAAAPPDLPLGVSAVLWDLSVPAGHEPTPEKVALGEKLFNDARLSSNGKVSCATCHDPARGFVDHKPLAEGVAAPAKRTQRHSPTVLNAVFNATQFWDGRAATLEDQAKLPITNPIEMGMKDGEAVTARLQSLPDYGPVFQKLYGKAPNFDDAANAIAAFERMQFSGNAPFDRYIAGDGKAIDAAAKRGWGLFNGKARCNSCHAFSTVSPLFSDQKFHNIGIAAHKTNFIDLSRRAMGIVRTGDMKQIDELAIETEFSELGRFLVTKHANDIGAFKTPTLRDVAITSPYMHDGSLATLWDVMDHYNKGGIPNPNLDGGMQRIGLTEPEIDDVVAFMATLTGDKFTEFSRKEMARMTGQKSKRPERDTAVAMGKKGNLGDLAPTPDPADPAAFGVLVLEGTSYEKVQKR